MKIVHCGMGKCGSTYLQKHVFPKLCEHFGLEYNPPEFEVIKQKRLVGINSDIDQLKKRVREANVLISSELLIGWNPRDWEKNAQQNLLMFGEDASIVILSGSQSRT